MDKLDQMALAFAREKIPAPHPEIPMSDRATIERRQAGLAEVLKSFARAYAAARLREERDWFRSCALLVQDKALIESHKSKARLLDRMADEEESNDGS